MKTKNYLLLFLLSPMLIVVLINQLSPASTSVYREEECTRYCHNKACLHLEQNKLTSTLLTTYEANIRWLKHNPLGLGYREMNLVVYVLLVPFLAILLLWGLIRKRHG